MIRKAVQIYCANEHGFGDVTFPDDGIFDWERWHNAKAIRAAAKKEGWGRILGEDYCPTCMNLEREREP